MRRRALVVAAAVSAVLAGGIMVATTAGAEETPDALAIPSIEWPDLAGVPQLPVFAGVPDAPDVAAVPDDPGPGAAQGGPAAQDAPADDAGPGRPGGAAKPADADAPAAIDRPDRPAADDDAARPAADDDAAGPAVDDDKRNKATRPGMPAALPPAQRDVTVSQALSADPRGTVQQQALDLVNQSRRRGGCGDVTVDRRLILAANRHAADMARRGYFAHEDTRGDRAGDRVEAAGYEWSRFGENIARGQESVYEVVDGWMHSPEHRENIMDCRLHQVGLGLAFSGDRTSYWVQDFATPQ